MNKKFPAENFLGVFGKIFMATFLLLMQAIQLME